MVGWNFTCGFAAHKFPQAARKTMVALPQNIARLRIPPAMQGRITDADPNHPKGTHS